MTIPAERIRALPFFPLHEPPAADAQGQPILRLNLNESPQPPSPRVIEAIAAAAGQLNLYPDGESTALIEALAKLTGHPADRVFVGAGSNELLAASAEIALDPGDEMIAPAPAFPTYAKLAAIRAARFTGVPLLPDGRIDMGAMLAAVTKRTRLMFVSSPHNPTGTVLSGTEIARLCAELPEHVLLHFDEAYYEFGRAAGGAETLPLLTARKGPWISTRTFSKAFGLAGARVGYGLAGSAELATAIRKVRSNFSLGRLSLAAGLAALTDMPHSQAMVAELLSEGRRMRAELAKAGHDPLETAANFIALRCPQDGIDRLRALKDQGILIIGFPLADRQALRITIGDRAANDRVIAALRGLAPASGSLEPGGVVHRMSGLDT